MIKIYVANAHNYSVDLPKVQRSLKDFFQKKGVNFDAFVSVSFVDEKEMVNLAERYLKERSLHDVLSFPFTETKNFIDPPDNIRHLGDIVICYPKAVLEARREGKSAHKKVLELVKHGGLHLLGKHHE